jgi:hypothetical protein
MTEVWIERVTLAVGNLYEGYMRFRRETGVPTVDGGDFPDLGLARISAPSADRPLVNLISVIQRSVAVEKATGAWLFDSTSHGDRWVGLTLGVRDPERLEAIATRSATPISDRLRFDGAPTRLFTPQGSLATVAPHVSADFGENEHQPAVEVVADGPRPAADYGIEWVEIGGTADEFTRRIEVAPEELGIRCNGAAHGIYAVSVVAKGVSTEIRPPR